MRSIPLKFACNAASYDGFEIGYDFAILASRLAAEVYPSPGNDSECIEIEQIVKYKQRGRQSNKRNPRLRLKYLSI